MIKINRIFGLYRRNYCSISHALYLYNVAHMKVVFYISNSGWLLGELFKLEEHKIFTLQI